MGFLTDGLLAPSSFSLQVSTPLPLDFAGLPPKMPYLINVTLSHMTDFGQQYMSGSNSVEVSSLNHVLACPPEIHLEKSVAQ